MSAGIYGSSIAAAKLRRALADDNRPRLAMFDIDSTLTGSHERANHVRALLETGGYVAAFNTSRTEEMVLSEAAYRRNSTTIVRPAPQLGKDDNGARLAVPPESVEPRGVLDGDIIAGSTGTRILVRQEDDRYLVDGEYEGRYGLPPEAWRERALVLLHALRGRGCRFALASIEDPAKYQAGRSDVFPPAFRVQIDVDSEDEKLMLVRALTEVQRDPRLSGIARSVRLTDDSHPEPDRFKLFLTPRTGSKLRAAERIVGCLCAAAGIERPSLSVLFAGDSFPDLAMGLLGGFGTDATFLLAGGSRLKEALVGSGPAVFVGEGVQAIRRRLSPTARPGYYRFRAPLDDEGSRTLVIGDELFPGTQAVETVECFLEALPHSCS